MVLFFIKVLPLKENNQYIDVRYLKIKKGV